MFVFKDCGGDFIWELLHCNQKASWKTWKSAPELIRVIAEEASIIAEIIFLCGVNAELLNAEHSQSV